MNPSFHDLKFA